MWYLRVWRGSALWLLERLDPFCSLVCLSCSRMETKGTNHGIQINETQINLLRLAARTFLFWCDLAENDFEGRCVFWRYSIFIFVCLNQDLAVEINVIFPLNFHKYHHYYISVKNFKVILFSNVINIYYYLVGVFYMKGFTRRSDFRQYTCTVWNIN